MFHRLGSRLCVFACSMLIFSQPPVANGEVDFHVRPAELSTSSSSFQKLEQTVRKLELLSELETFTRELKNLVDFEFDIETKPRDLQQLTDGESELNVVDSNNVADVSALAVRGYDGIDKVKRAGMEHEKIKRYAKSKGKDYRQSSRYKASSKNLKARSLLFQHNNGAIQLSADQVAKAGKRIGKFKIARKGFSNPSRSKAGVDDQNPFAGQQEEAQ